MSLISAGSISLDSAFKCLFISHAEFTALCLKHMYSVQFDIHVRNNTKQTAYFQTVICNIM
jgi:hypothetical protein